MELKTEYEFILPRGYVDANGTLHREGVMRLANAKDEIVPLNDLRVQRRRGINGYRPHEAVSNGSHDGQRHQPG